MQRFALLCLADSIAVGLAAAECSLAELRDGVRLQKLRPVKGPLQEERKYVLLTELVHCEAGKNMKVVSNRLLPYIFSFFVQSYFPLG